MSIFNPKYKNKNIPEYFASNSLTNIFSPNQSWAGVMNLGPCNGVRLRPKVPKGFEGLRKDTEGTKGVM